MVLCIQVSKHCVADILVNFSIVNLFTNVLVDEALSVVWKVLDVDENWGDRSHVKGPGYRWELGW
jgi:hypothetical protein